MKRLLLITYLVCCVISMMAANTLSLSASNGNWGEEITVSARISLDEDVTALEVTIPLNPQLRYVENSALFNSNKLVGFTTSSVLDGNELKIHIYSLSLQNIERGTYDLFSFKVKLGDIPGTYSMIPTCKMSDNKGKNVSCMCSGTNLTLYTAVASVDKSLSYDEVVVGQQQNKTLNVRNTGNKTLNVTSVLPSSDIISVSENSFVLEPGETKEIRVAVNPTVRGVLKENINIISDAAKSEVYCDVLVNAVSWNNVTIPSSASAKGGEEIVIPVGLDNVEDIIALEFDIELPTGISISENSGVVTDRARGLSVSVTQSGNVAKFIMFSFNKSVISQGNGTIFEFKLTPTVYLGNYTFKVSNQKIISKDNDEVAYGSVSSCALSIRSPRANIWTSEISEFFVKGSDSECVFELRNIGNENLVIDKILINGEEHVIEDVASPVTIPSSKSFYLKHFFCPDKVGTQKMEVEIYSNDPVNPVVTKVYTVKVIDKNFLSLGGELLGNKDFLMHIGMNNDADVTAIQMDIICPTNMIVDNSSFELSDRLKDTHTINVSSFEPGKCRVLIYSNTNSIIKGKDGELVSVLFVNNSNSSISYNKFSLGNVLIGDARGVNKNSIEQYNFNSVYYYYSESMSGTMSIRDSEYRGTGSLITSKYGASGNTFVMGNSTKNLYEWYAYPNIDCEVVTCDANKNIISTSKVKKGTFKQLYVSDVSGKLFYGWSDGKDILSREKYSSFFVKESCTVYPIFTSDLFASENEIAIDRGKYRLLRVLMGDPKIVVESGIQWSSSDDSTVSVNANGIIQALKPGHAIVTATVSGIDAPVNFDVYVTAETNYIYANVETEGTGEVSVSGATYDQESKTAVQGERMTITATPAEGYQFESWSNDGKEISRENPYTFVLNADANIFAKLVPKQYKITYIVDNIVYAIQAVNFGQEVSGADKPIREGYYFYGWKGLPEKMPAHDVTVTGTFMADIILGDANNSGEVNVTDITAVVSHIYGKTPDNFNMVAADVNGSGEINVVDITGIVGIIYGGSANKGRNSSQRDGSDIILSIPSVSTYAGAEICMPIYINNADETSAYQFDVNLPDGIKVKEVHCNSDDHECFGAYIEHDKYRLLSYSLVNDNFISASAPVGYITLAVDDNIQPGEYYLGLLNAISSVNGKECQNMTNGGKITVDNATSINGVWDNTRDTRHTTTVGGVKIKSGSVLPKGIYIMDGKKIVK